MTHPESADGEDVRRALAGDRDAFGRLFDRHARVVRAVVVAVAGDFEAVDDLTQETFLRAYRRLASLRDANGFRNWIQGIARLVAKERLRQLVRDRELSDDRDVLLIAKESAGDEVQHAEEQRRVMAAVQQLPEKERLAVHAYFFHEQNGDEAAAAIGISRSGFYAALERVLKRLRTLMSDGSRSSENVRNEP